MLSGDKDVLAEYAKRVKVGGASQQSQYLRDVYQLTDNYVDILFKKGLKRSQCVIPLNHVNQSNLRAVDCAHHALQISQALMKVIKNSLSADELKQAPSKHSAAKQAILDLCAERDDDDIVVRLEKPKGGSRAYEYYSIPYYAFKPSRDNCAYHEIITGNVIRWFADIDHSTPDLFH